MSRSAQAMRLEPAGAREGSLISAWGVAVATGDSSWVEVDRPGRAGRSAGTGQEALGLEAFPVEPVEGGVLGRGGLAEVDQGGDGAAVAVGQRFAVAAVLLHEGVELGPVGLGHGQPDNPAGPARGQAGMKGAKAAGLAGLAGASQSVAEHDNLPMPDPGGEATRVVHRYARVKPR